MALPSQPHGSWATALLTAGLCGALACFLYLPTLEGAFVWDDERLIVGNREGIDAWRDVIAAFGRKILPDANAPYYRPILIGSYAVDHRIAGLDPAAFHRTNVVLHGLNTALLCAALFAIVGSTAAATLGALVFAVHPLGAFSVSLVTCRNELLLASPAWAALLAYSLWARARGRRRARLHFAVVLLYAITLWTKETGIVLPAVLVAFDVLVLRPQRRSAAAYGALLGSWVGVTALYFLTRWAVLGEWVGGDVYRAVPWEQRIPNAVAILGYYLRRTLLPFDFSAAPYHPGLADPRSLDWLVAAVLCVGFAVLLTRWATRRPLIAFGLAQYALWLLPVLGFVPLKLLILENRAYLPLTGFALVIAAGARALGVDRRPARLVAGLLLVATLAALTRQRLPEFHDELALWSAATRATPRSSYARREYGAALLEAAREPEALEQLGEAVRLDPAAADPRLLLAVALARGGREAAALYQVRQVLRRWPQNRRALALMKQLTGVEGGAAGPRSP